LEKILVINGPNLNLLGSREPDLYGLETLDSINKRLADSADSRGAEIVFFQNNIEGEIVNRIHQARSEGITHIIVNAAAYTHTSIAIRDALSGVQIPFIEVHLSNVYAREEFRQKSFLSDKASGVICGFGSFSYDLALDSIFRKPKL
jgi:3-dehydroquinate dehydratase-2